MTKRCLTLVIIIMSLSLVGCANTSKEQIGTLAGGIAGGIIGAGFGAGGGQILGIGVGAYTGAVLGNIIGKSIDHRDGTKAGVNTKEYAWIRPQNGPPFRAILESDWITVQSNPYCHQYLANAYINGTYRHVHGIACRQADGTWLKTTRIIPIEAAS